MSEPESDWEREKAFWAACKVQTYDLEYTGGHRGGWEMLKQSHDPSGTNHGDWVCAEDFRSRVEVLERELQSAAQEANDLNRTVERLTQELAAERAELQRCRELLGRVLGLGLSPHLLRQDKRIRERQKHMLADLLEKIAPVFDALSAEAPRELGPECPECPACKEERGDYWREECADLTRKLEQAQRENATLAADNERLCKELLEARNALAEQSLRLGKVGDERDEAIAKLLKAATLLDRAERYIGHNSPAAGEAICRGIRELREGS